MSHIKIFDKDGKHLGLMHKGLFSALKDVENKYGNEIYKTISTLIKNKHEGGSVIHHGKKKISLPDDKVSNEEIIEIISSLISHEGKHEGGELLEEPIIVKSEKPLEKVKKKTGSSEEQTVNNGIQKWKIS